MFPAFKEWHVIVEALLTGEQILILRKGGISEDCGGFDPGRAGRFWLFPTQFHAQAEKTKPAAARFIPAATPVDNTHVVVRGFADLVHHAFITDRNAVAPLEPFHLWTEATIRERFDWANPPGIHAFVVRAHRLATPITLPLTADIGGCKSWIELPMNFNLLPSAPVLDDADFTARRAALPL